MKTIFNVFKCIVWNVAGRSEQWLHMFEGDSVTILSRKFCGKQILLLLAMITVPLNGWV